MRDRKLLIVVLLSWMVGTSPNTARADVQAVLACRQLPPGPGRADCLEKASAGLEQEAIGNGSTRSAAPTPAVRPASRSRFTAGVDSITYRDGRPVFRLDNGQTWYSVDRRRLTFKRGRGFARSKRPPSACCCTLMGPFLRCRWYPKRDSPMTASRRPHLDYAAGL